MSAFAASSVRPERQDDEQQSTTARAFSKTGSCLAALLLTAGVLWHGITLAVLHRIWNNLINRPDEPMAFRFILQPMMALVAAIHDGLRDARAGRSLYICTVLHDPQRRVARLRE